MKNLLLLRYGEIHLKGKNRRYFENVLLSNIKRATKDFCCKVQAINGRYLVEDYEPRDEKKLISQIQKVFGLVSLSRAVEIDTDIKEIENQLKALKITQKTFRVSVVRADKTFPMRSSELEPMFGGFILDANPNLKVSLKNYDVDVIVEIRENKKTYIISEKIPCLGGMPVSTSGRGLLLLSGGIDSPVAGFEIAKRGMSISAVHFHSYPYTSEQAKQKVVKLRDIISDYCGNIKLYCVKFTHIQEEIHKNCDEEYMITIMRRFMMRIAEKICLKNKYQAIITGESLGQVASQTIEGMTSTQSVLNVVPILRPLVCFDKQETMTIAQHIGTYETSILPYEDCCTVFLPKNPLIKPKLNKVEEQESKLDIEALVDEALAEMEIL